MPRTIADVKRINNDRGFHFFSKSTMRFFSSRIETKGTLINRQYFITSEKFDSSSPRLYTIREAKSDGNINTVGEFQQYKSKQQAISEARRL